MENNSSKVPLILLFIFFVSIPMFLHQTAWDYYLSVITRIFIFALFATSLDLLVGYGRLASMGHALFFGLGAYAIGIISFHFGPELFHSYLLMAGIGLIVTIFVAYLLAKICLSLSGVFFIMLTLAFGQLAFYLISSLGVYGGEDGLAIDIMPRIPFFGELETVSIYYLAFFSWLGGYLFCKKLLKSHFGLAYIATSSNMQKASSMGFKPQMYRTIMFVIAALLANVAGTILAVLNLFISPDLLHWTKSADGLVMVILGGMKTLVGGFWGASALILIEEFLAPVLHWWHLILGVVLVSVVLLRKGGIYHLLLILKSKIKRRL